MATKELFVSFRIEFLQICPRRKHFSKFFFVSDSNKPTTDRSNCCSSRPRSTIEFSRSNIFLRRISSNKFSSRREKLIRTNRFSPFLTDGPIKRKARLCSGLSGQSSGLALSRFSIRLSRTKVIRVEFICSARVLVFCSIRTSTTTSERNERPPVNGSIFNTSRIRS